MVVNVSEKFSPYGTEIAFFLFECKANHHKWLQISGFVSSFSSVIFDQGVRG